jgi:hypothetical protein
MCTSHIVVNISDRTIDRIVLCVASTDGNSGFIAAEDNWYEHGAVRIWIPGDFILRGCLKKIVKCDKTGHEPLASKPNFRT